MSWSKLWCEKYRPETLDDVIGQELIVAQLKNVPEMNYLFHSAEAGTGKTSVARALARELHYTIHEFNASTKASRGIEFVEQEIMPLVATNNPRMVILLDEADQLTTAAQSALKGVIENASCIFILTCNDLNKISVWLQSRCLLQRFDAISDEEILARLTYIMKQEGKWVEYNHLQRIIRAHRGDLRNCINALQAVSPLNEEERETYTLMLANEGFDVQRFLNICFRDKDIESAVKLFANRDPRQTIREVFTYATNNPSQNTEYVMTVIEAAIVSERDLINGVLPDVVVWNFCRILCLGFIGRTDLGQNNPKRN